MPSLLDIDASVVPIVERMQSNGLPVDPDYFPGLAQWAQQQQEELIVLIEMLTGKRVNPNSSPQTAQMVYDELGLEAEKRTKGGARSTGKKALTPLKDHPVVGLLVEAREHNTVERFAKLLPKYIREDTDPVRRQQGRGRGPRAYYKLRLTRAKTGRLAAHEFNALGIPTRTALGRKVRHGFPSRPGYRLGTWDLEQIEMKVMAHRSQDPVLIDIYNRDPRHYPKWERDVHILTAADIFGRKPQDVPKPERTACKSTGFGIIMGITELGLHDQMRLYGLSGKYSVDDCARFIREWLKKYKGVDQYQQQKRAEARRNGYVTDMWGRYFPLPGACCPIPRVAEEAARQSHALDIQSSAQGIEKMIMRAVWEEVLPWCWREGLDVEPLLQIHDELIFEFEEGAEEVLNALMLNLVANIVKLSVPITAGSATGAVWDELEK